jgi:hypothetical protein
MYAYGVIDDIGGSRRRREMEKGLTFFEFFSCGTKQSSRKKIKSKGSSINERIENAGNPAAGKLRSFIQLFKSQVHEIASSTY